jgi:hypothetical protein
VSRLVVLLLVALAVSACGDQTTREPATEAMRRAVAEHFAAALFRGDAMGARALLVRRDEPALVFLVRRATARWRRQDVSIEFPARLRHDRWELGYAGRRTYRDGRFERETGDLVVLVASAEAGARVRFFAFANVRTTFSTHHDAQLLPSKR